LRVYAAQAKDETLIRHATEIRMRAERRADELLIGMAERKERHQRGGTGAHRGELKSQRETSVPTLTDLGINKTQSSRWQTLARRPEDQFERDVERASTGAYNRMTGRFVKEVEIAEAQERHSKLIEQGCTADDLVALAASGKRFSVIYADPPWDHGFSFDDNHLSAYHRSISPNTTSSEPRIAEMSANMCPRLRKSIAWRCANEGARILHLYGRLVPSDTR
jgi:hypothetical protein